MNLNQPGIYKITNLVNNKFYIGSSVILRKRLTSHKRDLNKNKHANRYLQNSWNKYGENNFKFEVIEVIPKTEFTDNEYLIDIEQMYLDTYQCYRREIGYNICQFARSALGVKHTEETKQKASKRMLGWKKPNAHNGRYAIRIKETELIIDIKLENTKSYRFGGFKTKEEAINYVKYLRALSEEAFINLGEISVQLRSACGYHGVVKQDGRYQSRVAFNGKEYYLGMHSTALEAALVYNNFVIMNNIERPLNIINLNG